MVNCNGTSDDVFNLKESLTLQSLEVPKLPLEISEDNGKNSDEQ